MDTRSLTFAILTTLAISFALALSVTSLSGLNDVSTSFSDGDTLSAAAFNDLFGAINANFQSVVGRIDAFTGTLDAESCEAGQVIQAIDADGVVTCVEHVPERPVVVAARVTPGVPGDQLIPSGTLTAVEFSGVVFDTAGVWSDENPTRITAPEAGIYLVAAEFGWNELTIPDSAAYLSVHREDMTVLLGSIASIGSIGSSSASPTIGVTGLVALEEDEYIELRVYQQTGHDWSLWSLDEFGVSFHRVADLPGP